MATAAIVLAALLVHGQSLGGSFHYDDEHSVKENYHIRSLDRPWRFFVDPLQFSVDADKAMYRPLVVASMAANYAIGKDDPRGYLAWNLAVHVGVALAVWALAARLGATATGAFIAGLLFAAHPLATEPINYVSSRSESMAVLLGLAAVAWRDRCPTSS